MFNIILKQAKETKEYNKTLTYGTYQIEKEINTFYQQQTDKSKKNIYNYPELNGNIKTLKTMLNEYYEKNIQPKFFEYKLLK